MLSGHRGTGIGAVQPEMGRGAHSVKRGQARPGSACGLDRRAAPAYIRVTFLSSPMTRCFACGRAERREILPREIAMPHALLMPKATAVWLVENTTLTFDQIADFCKLHPLEVRAIADGDAAQ